MQDNPHKPITIGHICLKKVSKNRKTLQMAILTVHDPPKRSKQYSREIQTQSYSSNHSSKVNQQMRIPSPEFNNIQKIRYRKSYEASKNLNNYAVTQSQNTQRNLEFKKQRSNSPFIRLQDLRMQRLKRKLQKIQIKAKIHLLTIKKQKDTTQRVLSRLDQITQEKLSQSLSCRQMLVHHPKIPYNSKEKNNKFRPKITFKENWRQKLMSRSLQTKRMQELCQDHFQGWKTIIKQEQPQDFRYYSIESS